MTALCRLRRSPWFWPLAGLLSGVLLGVVLAHPSLDADQVLRRLAVRVDAPGARSIVLALLGTVVTAISIVLSVSMSVIQNASSQFSPRLAQAFLREPGTQAMLSVFAGTVAYALTVLYLVGFQSPNAALPRVAVTGTMVLALSCVCLIIVQIHRTMQAIRVERILQVTRNQALEAVPDRDGGLQGAAPRPLPAPDDATPIPAKRTGTLRSVDRAALLHACAKFGVSLRLRPMVGHAIVQDAPIGWAWRDDGQAVAQADLAVEVDRVLLVGSSREAAQDVALGIRQLVDTAIKALSPAVNDPYTAVQAIDHLTPILCRLAQAPCGEVVLHDSRDAYVLLPAPRFGQYVQLAFDQIVRYGAGEPSVLRSVLHAIETVSAATAPAQFAVWLRWIAAVRTAAERGLTAAEQAELAPAVDAVTAWVEGNRAPREASVALL